MMMKTLTTLCMVGALGASAAFAGPIDNRQHAQRERIQQGVKSGELTRPEARRLAQQEAGIRRLEAQAKSDGKITRSEALRLDRRLDAAGRHIAVQKHDRQDR